MARLILTGRKRDLMGARPMKVVDDLGGAITTIVLRVFGISMFHSAKKDRFIDPTVDALVRSRWYAWYTDLNRGEVASQMRAVATMGMALGVFISAAGVVALAYALVN
jgi:hypothetical protein